MPLSRDVISDVVSRSITGAEARSESTRCWWMLSRRFSTYCRRATYAAAIHIATNTTTIDRHLHRRPGQHRRKQQHDETAGGIAESIDDGVDERLHAERVGAGTGRYSSSTVALSIE